MKLTIAPTIPNWLKLVFLIIIGVIIVSLIRGCTNQQRVLDANKKLIEDNQKLTQKIKSDSSNRLEAENEYKATIQNQSAVIEINENKWISTLIDLNKANDTIDKLLHRYKPIQPNLDTNITTVPNLFINDCNDCFTQLSGQQQRIGVVKDEMNKLKQSLEIKINTQENRINDLGKEKRNLQASLNVSQSLINQYARKIEPRRKVFFTLTAIGANDLFILGGGAGFLYMDKRERIYGANGYGTNKGPLITASISLPLSLRFVK